MSEITVKRPHIGIDTHIIVIKDDEQVIGSIGRVVDALEGEAAPDGGVADDGDHVAARMLMVHFRGHCHAERCGKRV